MTDHIPSIFVSGASGIVGRQFLETAKNDFSIFALSRRSQREAGVGDHSNIHWLQLDLGDSNQLDEMVAGNMLPRRVDYILHLASYHDFEKKNHPEYERTNITGTRNLLEVGRRLEVKRFIYVSSVLASEFSPEGRKINERTPADACHPYGKSKAAGEKMAAAFSRWFPCSVVRCGAAYTDWCEFGPLASLLEGWLIKRRGSRLICGRGRSAIPFIHSKDLIRLFLEVLRKSAQLPVFDVYLACLDGAVSHRDIYHVSTRYYFGRSRPPRYIPRMIVYLGLLWKDMAGRLRGKRPFERVWMARYIDRRLEADPSYTQKALSWEPSPRDRLLERLPILIDKMKRFPEEWRDRNALAMKRKGHGRGGVRDWIV